LRLTGTWQRARAHNISLARNREAAQEPRSVGIAPARRSGLGAPSALGSVGSLACLVGKTGRRGWRVLADLLHRTCGAEGMESPCGGSALLIPYSCGRLSGGRTRHEHTDAGCRLGASAVVGHSADSGRFAVRPRREFCKLLTHGFCRHYM
jgi:hypothetical protein